MASTKRKNVKCFKGSNRHRWMWAAAGEPQKVENNNESKNKRKEEEGSDEERTTQKP